MTNSPPLNQNKFKLKIQGINAVCDLQFPDFYKIKSKTFYFLHQSHSPRLPGSTHPQSKQGNVWEIIILLSLFTQIQTKILKRFLAAVAFPPFYNCNNLTKQDAGKSGGQWVTQNVTQITRWRRKKIIFDHASPSSLAYVSINNTSLCISMPDLKIYLSLTPCVKSTCTCEKSL